MKRNCELEQEKVCRSYAFDKTLILTKHFALFSNLLEMQDILHKQSVVYQNQLQELISELENQRKAMDVSLFIMRVLL